MSAAATFARPAAAAARAPRTSFPRLLQAEWIKLWSVRSSVIMLAAAAVIAIVVGIGFAVVGESADAGPGVAATDSLSLSMAGIELSRLVIGVLGVMVVSTEYSTGLIRTSLAAVPGRVAFLGAKVVVFGAVAFATMLAASAIAVVAGSAVYGGDTAIPLSDPAVWRAVAGAAFYSVAVGLIGMGLGVILRSTAAAIGTLVGFLMVFPGLVGLLPESTRGSFEAYLPSNAGSSLARLEPAAGMLSAGPALVVLAVWVGVALGFAAWLLRRRDV